MNLIPFRPTYVVLGAPRRFTDLREFVNTVLAIDTIIFYDFDTRTYFAYTELTDADTMRKILTDILYLPNREYRKYIKVNEHEVTLTNTKKVEADTFYLDVYRDIDKLNPEFRYVLNAIKNYEKYKNHNKIEGFGDFVKFLKKKYYEFKWR